MKEREYIIKTDVVSHNTYRVYATSEEDAYEAFCDGDYELISSEPGFETYKSATVVE